MVGRLIERSRLLIALSEEIPTETKLQTQPLLKQLEQAARGARRGAGRRPDPRRRTRLLCRELQEYADLDALPRRMENFLPPDERARRRPRPRPDAIPRRSVLHDDARGHRAPTSSRWRRRAAATKGGTAIRPVDGVPVFFLALNRNKRGHHARPAEGRGAGAAPPPAAAFRRAGRELRRRHARALGAGARSALSRASAADRREPVGLRADGAVARAALVRHHHAGGERVHVAHRLSRTSRRRAAAARSATTCRACSARSPCWARSWRADRTGTRAGHRRVEPGRDVLVAGQWPSIFAASGRLPRQVGNRHLAAVPYDAYQARDGWLVDRRGEQQALPTALRRRSAAPSWATIHASAASRGRLEHGDEINAIVCAWVGEHTVDEVLRSSVPTAPASRAHPSTPSTSSSITRSCPPAAWSNASRTPSSARCWLPGVVIKMSDTPGAVRKLGPQLGEHTDDVLKALLGLWRDELARLRADQVI